MSKLRGIQSTGLNYRFTNEYGLRDYIWRISELVTLLIVCHTTWPLPFRLAGRVRSNNFFHGLDVKGGSGMPNTQERQMSIIRIVEGIVTTKYTHNWLETVQRASPKVKKVVLKSACNCMSQNNGNRARWYVPKQRWLVGIPLLKEQSISPPCYPAERAC